MQGCTEYAFKTAAILTLYTVVSSCSGVESLPCVPLRHLGICLRNILSGGDGRAGFPRESHVMNNVFHCLFVAVCTVAASALVNANSRLFKRSLRYV